MDIAEKTLQLKQDFDEVYEAGKTKEWSDFWEVQQKTAWSTRTDYNFAFAGGGWSTDNFIPKYDIKVTTAERMFQSFGSQKGKSFNLASHLRNLNINLDFSNCTRFFYTFAYSFITTLPTIDFSKCTVANNAFDNSQIATIEKLIFSENTVFSSMFEGANNLKNINEIEGTIGKSVSFSACPFTKASITNVVNALSSTTSGLTCTFKKTAKEAAFTTDEWATLIATKPNWTFSLV